MSRRHPPAAAALALVALCGCGLFELPPSPGGSDAGSAPDPAPMLVPGAVQLATVPYQRPAGADARTEHLLFVPWVARDGQRLAVLAGRGYRQAGGMEAATFASLFLSEDLGKTWAEHRLEKEPGTNEWPAAVLLVPGKIVLLGYGVDSSFGPLVDPMEVDLAKGRFAARARIPFPFAVQGTTVTGFSVSKQQLDVARFGRYDLLTGETSEVKESPLYGRECEGRYGSRDGHVWQRYCVRDGDLCLVEVRPDDSFDQSFTCVRPDASTLTWAASSPDAESPLGRVMLLTGASANSRALRILPGSPPTLEQYELGMVNARLSEMTRGAPEASGMWWASPNEFVQLTGDGRVSRITGPFSPCVPADACEAHALDSGRTLEALLPLDDENWLSVFTGVWNQAPDTSRLIVRVGPMARE